jgi:hypothetical protein
MQLAVQPEELAAASGALSRIADRLSDEIGAFVHVSVSNAPALGVEATEGAIRGTAAARQAAETIAADIRSLAAAFRVLAQEYPQLDAGAVPHR